MLLLFGLWAYGYVRGRFSLPDAVRSARLPLIFLAIWVGYGLLQILLLPVDWVAQLSPATYEIYQYAALVEPRQWIPLTVDTGVTWVESLKHISYVGLFFLTLVLINSPFRLRLLAVALITIGIGESIFGLFAYFSNLDLLGWDHQTRSVKEVLVRGTYANRNHFAAFLAMMTATALGLVIAGMRVQHEESGWRARLSDWMQDLLSLRGLLIGGIILLLATLLLTTSRGGVFSFSAAFVIVITYAYLTVGRSAPAVRLAPLVFGAVVLAIFWLGAEGLQERLLTTDLQMEGRFPQWRISVAVANDYPILGSGAGTYATVFPLYRDGSLPPLFFEHVHNDYLELLIEQGIVGFVLLGCAIVLLLSLVLDAYRRRHDLLMRGMLFASLVGTGTLLIHGLLDFNFQIPANAGYFFVLLGIGVVAATLPHESRRRRRRN